MHQPLFRYREEAFDEEQEAFGGAEARCVDGRLYLGFWLAKERPAPAFALDGELSECGACRRWWVLPEALEPLNDPARAVFAALVQGGESARAKL